VASPVPVPPLRLVFESRSQPASAAPPMAKAAKVVHVAALRIGALLKEGFKSLAEVATRVPR
jgi:hypothetical protein